MCLLIGMQDIHILLCCQHLLFKQLQIKEESIDI